MSVFQKIDAEELKNISLFMGKYVAFLGCVVFASVGAAASAVGGGFRATAAACDNIRENKEEDVAVFISMSPTQLLKSVKDIVFPPTLKELNERFAASSPDSLASFGTNAPESHEVETEEPPVPVGEEVSEPSLEGSGAAIT